jgi:predicted Zn-dependent protease
MKRFVREAFQPVLFGMVGALGAFQINPTEGALLVGGTAGLLVAAIIEMEREGEEPAIPGYATAKRAVKRALGAVRSKGSR